MSSHPFNLLFVCAKNSARSIMAEAILNHAGLGRFHAYSAGFEGTGQINPMALEQLRRSRLDVDDLRSKDWTEFSGTNSPPLDFVVTFDSIGDKPLPDWPGQPLVVSWSIDDPAHVSGTDEERKRAFTSCFQLLNRRISLLASLPLERFNRTELKSRFEEIGRQVPTA